ncbi:hypothetical protein DXG01_015845, partial [Tephrocybe rancida]
LRATQTSSTPTVATPTSTPARLTSRAARSQMSGIARLDAMERQLSMESLSSITDAPSPGTPPAEDEDAINKRMVLEEWDR